MRLSVFGVLFVFLLAGFLAACSEATEDEQDECYGAGYEDTRQGARKSRLFSFAIITDIHIGEGFLDYGSEGYDDDGEGHNGLIDKVNAAVDKVNANLREYDIRFVMVPGDLTDSSEKSEYVKAKQILDSLDVPYFPIIGNHDMWPYYRLEDGSWVETETPVGDAYFEEIFGDYLDALVEEFPDFARSPTPCHNPDFDITSYFDNYSFTYMGYHFVCLDMVTRAHAPEEYPGIGPDAALHDFEQGTWQWFKDHIEAYPCKADHNILVFLHHPPKVIGPFGLTEADRQTVGDYLASSGYAENIYGFFAGHLHFELLDTDYSGQQLVVTAAAKDDSTVRIVQVMRDGTIDFATQL